MGKKFRRILDGSIRGSSFHVNRTCTLFAVRKNIMFLHRFVLTRNQCPHRSLFFFSQNGIIWENEGRRVVNVGFYP